jgi:hypothetical protein
MRRLISPATQVVVLALMACAVLPFREATLLPDTVRDLGASLRLARGQDWPLVGPAINFGPPLGPAWVWLQAVPLLFSKSLAAVSLYVATVASLKYWLLYRLGREWNGPRLGIAIAVSAAFPSLAVYQWHMMFHPNWVESAIAAALLVALLAARRRSVTLWYVACVVLGLAVQLHPTAIFYLPVVMLALRRIERNRARYLIHALGATLAIAVWFAPLAFLERVDQGKGIGAVASGIEAGLRTFRFIDLATVLRTAYFEIPLSIGDTYAPYAGVPRLAWRLLLACASLGMGAGALAIMAAGSKRTRLTAAAILCALAVAWMVVCAVRTYTPFYLCYFLLPMSASLMGLALDRAMSSSSPLIRLSGTASVVATVACAAIASIGAVRMAHTGEITSRLPLMGDLRHPEPGTLRARLAGVAARDEIAGYLCRHGGEVAVHGDLAFALAASTNLDIELHCPGRTEVSIMGSGGWTILSNAEASRLGRKSALAFRGLLLFPVTAAYPPGNARPIERTWYQFDELHDARPMTHFAADFSTAPGEAVMVLRIKPSARWENFRISHNGVAAQPVSSTWDSQVYVGAQGRNDWHVEFDSNAPHWVDIHAF